MLSNFVSFTTEQPIVLELQKYNPLIKSSSTEADILWNKGDEIESIFWVDKNKLVLCNVFFHLPQTVFMTEGLIPKLTSLNGQVIHASFRLSSRLEDYQHLTFDKETLRIISVMSPVSQESKKNGTTQIISGTVSKIESVRSSFLFYITDDSYTHRQVHKVFCDKQKQIFANFNTSINYQNLCIGDSVSMLVRQLHYDEEAKLLGYTAKGCNTRSVHNILLTSPASSRVNQCNYTATRIDALINDFVTKPNYEALTLNTILQAAELAEVSSFNFSDKQSKKLSDYLSSFSMGIKPIFNLNSLTVNEYFELQSCKQALGIHHPLILSPNGLKNLYLAHHYRLTDDKYQLESLGKILNCLETVLDSNCLIHTVSCIIESTIVKLKTSESPEQLELYSLKLLHSLYRQEKSVEILQCIVKCMYIFPKQGFNTWLSKYSCYIIESILIYLSRAVREVAFKDYFETHKNDILEHITALEYKIPPGSTQSFLLHINKINEVEP
jgi:hypothetical protein